MADDIMPTTEAQDEGGTETAAYECAFHLLPTVADGEVAKAAEDIKKIITAHGGEVFDAEEPQRFALAYEIRKSAEGKSLRYTNSWLGWIRFNLVPSELESVLVELSHQSEIMRHLVTKLTREELANPKNVFATKQESAKLTSSEDGADGVEISEADLNKSLEEITS